MTTRAYFGFPRVTDSFAYSGGNWQSLLPLASLQRLPLSYVARSTDATTGSTVIIATAPAPVQASVLALIGHNLTQSATWRIRTWTDTAGTTGLVDSGSIAVWPASYTAAEVSGAVATAFYRFANPGPSTVGKIEIDINDTTNPAGYVQAGFLEIAAAFDVTYNFSFGAQYSFTWRSQLTEAIGGAEYVNRLDHPRMFKGTFDFSPRTDSLGKFYEMQRQLKFDIPVLFVPLPSETTHLLRTAMFARQTDPGPTTMKAVGPSGLLDTVPLALREIIG